MDLKELTTPSKEELIEEALNLEITEDHPIFGLEPDSLEHHEMLKHLKRLKKTNPRLLSKINNLD